MVAFKNRVDGQAAFVLHAQPFRETSLILDVFSRDWGRVALVARGARRPRSALRGLLLQFQPLELAWFGQGEVRTLAKAEWLGGLPLLGGRALLFGYYINELLLRLVPRDDPHDTLFAAYRVALECLAAKPPNEEVLRRFELMLLREIGYGVTLDREAESDRPIDPQRRYAWRPECGLVPAETARETQLFSGKALLQFGRDDFSDGDTLLQSKLLMRQVINHHLGGQVLHSRRVFMELQEL